MNESEHRERKADNSCAQKGYGVQDRMRDRASSIMRSIIRELLIPLSRVVISNIKSCRAHKVDLFIAPDCVHCCKKGSHKKE